MNPESVAIKEISQIYVKMKLPVALFLTVKGVPPSYVGLLLGTVLS